MDQNQKHPGALPPSRALEQGDTDDKRSASDVVPRARDVPKTTVSSQLKRSNSLARLKAAALDLEAELSHKEMHEHELERRIAHGEQVAQSLRERVQALEAELAGAKAATRLGVERARLAHEALQQEQDAFLALLLDDHEVELRQLKAERDEALAKAALADHRQLRGRDTEELEQRLSWLRGECDEARREAAEAQREADDARERHALAHTQRDAAVEEAERLRGLLGAKLLKQPPGEAEFTLHDAAGSDPPELTAQERTGAPRAAAPSPAPYAADARPTATAIPAAMFQARGRLSQDSSTPSSVPPPTLPPADEPRPADADEVSRRQGVRTAPAIPQQSAGGPGAGAPAKRVVELDTVPPPAASADITHDLGRGGPRSRQDPPAVTERKTARPPGPSDQPPALPNKPPLTRSPGGYSMPDDASGTIDVIKPFNPSKR